MWVYALALIFVCLVCAAAFISRAINHVIIEPRGSALVIRGWWRKRAASKAQKIEVL